VSRGRGASSRRSEPISNLDSVYGPQEAVAVCVRGAWSGGAGGATGSDEGEDSAVGEEGRVRR
jgi:hypothetical protein